MLANFARKYAENLTANRFRQGMNLWLPFVGSGIKIEHIAEDHREVTVAMRQRWYNTNYVGVHFGGSLYAMVDPFLMLMFMKNLGRDYIVWDKYAKIEFKKPGKGKVTATFRIEQQDIDEIVTATQNGEKYVFERVIEIKNPDGEICAEVTKGIYTRKKTKRS